MEQPDFPYTDGEEIKVIWHGGFVVLAYVTCFMGSYSAIRIMEHGLWRSEQEAENATFLSKHPRLATSVVLATCAVWSMHFIGMQAEELVGIDSYVCYDWFPTLASLLLSLMGLGAGVAVAGWDVFAGRDRVETLKHICRYDSTVASRSEDGENQLGSHHVHIVALFDMLHWIAAGSLLSACGALSMHYIGMIAMKGPFRRVWSFSYLAASVIFGYIIFFVGFWILFRPLHWYVEKSWYRQASATVIAVAVCFLHFFGMLSVTYIADTSDAALSQCSPGGSSFQGWRSDQFQVLVVAMIVPLVAFAVEHTISNELRRTYRQLLDVRLSGSDFLSESHEGAEDVEACPPSAREQKKTKAKKSNETTNTSMEDTESDVPGTELSKEIPAEILGNEATA